MSGSVLFIDQFGEVAGGQVVLQALIRAARADGRRVAVLAPMGGALEKALRQAWDGEVELHAMRPLSLRHRRKGVGDLLLLVGWCLYALRFLRLVAGFDVVYVNGARLALPFFLLSLLTWRPRWCYHLHLCHSGVEKRLFSLIAAGPRTHALVMASRFIHKDFLAARPNCRRARLRVLENCLGANFADLPFSDRFSPRRGPLTVALIGRVVAYKGHEVLPRLARRFPEIRFVIIGACTAETGALLEDLRQPSLPNLEYLGETDDLPALIEREAVHISLVPSRWEEPFGLVSIESMAASCITLVSNRGMLPCIAAATGAWCFADDQQLVAMIDQLRLMGVAGLQALARRQFENTQRLYGFPAFQAAFRGLLDGEPAPRPHSASVVAESTLPPVRVSSGSY
jgi:glycosyltransferase involved in cell wall biosynthesis